MGFHRRTAPLYFGGLPSGYDYLNDPAANGDPGAAAPADGKKATGPNQGTYFVAFGEDATASNTNRGLSAIAENTDILDDLFRTSQVAMRSQAATAVGSVSSITVTGDVYVGSPSDSPATANDQATRDRLIKIVDSNDNELEVSGVRVVATLIHNGASVNQVGVPASGFYTNPVLTVSPAIPNGTAYKVYFLARRSLNDIIRSKPGEFFFEQVRTSHRVDAQVRKLLRELHSNTSSQNWDQAWTTGIHELATRGLDGTYRFSTSGATLPGFDDEFFPDLLDTGGSGAYIYRDGPAFTIFGAGEGMYVDPIQALMRLDADDVGQPRGTTGLVSIGNRRADGSYVGDSAFMPGLATMLSTVARRQLNTVDASSPRTRLIGGSTVTLTTVSNDPETGESYIEVPAGQYFWEIPGGIPVDSYRTAINIGYDLIELQYDVGGNTVYRTYVMVKAGSSAAPTNNRRMRLRQLDGTVPDFAGATNAIFRRWHSVVFAVGDGGGPRHREQHGYAEDESVRLNGLFFATPAKMDSTDSMPEGQPIFCAAEPEDDAYALEWGSIGGGTPPTGYARKGFLAGNGLVSGDGGFQSSNGAVASLYGPYPYTSHSETVTNATTTLECNLTSYRHFLFDANTTPTLAQTVTVTFTSVPTLRTGMQMVIVFVQPSSGASGGAMDITSWPASAKFESEADAHPAVGLDKMTVWKGIYVKSAWRFTKHVYD